MRRKLTHIPKLLPFSYRKINILDLRHTKPKFLKPYTTLITLENIKMVQPKIYIHHNSQTQPLKHLKNLMMTAILMTQDMNLLKYTP